MRNQPPPITLSWKSQTGEWKKIDTIANEGRYVWRMPEDLPFEIFLKVEAVDQAGNVGHDERKEPVNIDLSTPRARVTNVGVVTPKGP
jgi:hypothetical protein